MPHPIPLHNGHLGPDRTQAYWDVGYLFPIPAIAPQEAADYRAELERIERDWLDNGLPLPLNTYKRVNAHCVMPMAARLARNPAVPDAIKGIMGPDILIYAAEFFIKEPRTTRIVSMHQDLTYWGLGATQGLVTAWIALSPSTPVSGRMNFVRASHKNPILPHKDTHDANNLLSRGQEVRVDPGFQTTVDLGVALRHRIATSPVHRAKTQFGYPQIAAAKREVFHICPLNSVREQILVPGPRARIEWDLKTDVRVSLFLQFDRPHHARGHDGGL